MPTHGSLTKAGKVRNQTPKVETIKKKGPIPRIRNFSNYHKRIILGREISRSKRRRRR